MEVTKDEYAELKRDLATAIAGSVNDRAAAAIEALQARVREYARALMETHFAHCADYFYRPQRHAPECLMFELLERDRAQAVQDVRAAREAQTRAALSAAQPKEGECAHTFESNPGMYDTSHRYCKKCGVAE